MQIRELHTWEVDYAEAVRIQEQLRDKLVLEDEPGEVRLVAGVDVSYAKEYNRMFACVAVFEYPELNLIEQADAELEAGFPYIPGLLTFREGPVVLEACRQLSTAPDLVLFDGQGIAHPRRLGLAAHLGLILDLPSIGCAKTRLVGKYDSVPSKVGSYSWLAYQGARVGAVVRTKPNVKPIFVSPGHRINLESAIKWTLACCRGYKLPEPTRLAHALVNQARLQHARRAAAPLHCSNSLDSSPPES